MSTTRYGDDAASGAKLASDWSLGHAVPPCALFGANGMRFGPDGQLYVTQAFGSQITALDAESGAARVVSPVGGAVVAPDDIAFDTKGIWYATEVMSGRIAAGMPDGTTRVVADNLPAANGVTAHGDRVFMDEFRPGGRMFEVYADGSAPRLIADDLPFPNALCLGPDDHIYFPAVPLGEIWRVPVAGGKASRFTGDLDHPVSVKFDKDGNIITTQSGSGEITRIDLQSGKRTTLGTVRPGIDNFALSADGRLFVSHFVDGGVAEIMPGGRERRIVEPGMLGPWGLAVTADGTLYAADGLSVLRRRPDGSIDRPGRLLMHGFPGFARNVAVGGDGTMYLANTGGAVASYVFGEEAKFLVDGLDQVMGIAVQADGSVLVCEYGGGRLLSLKAGGAPTTVASGLDHPTGVAIGDGGRIFVAEGGTGRVAEIRGKDKDEVLSGLQEPHGLAVAGDDLYVLDRAGKAVHHVALSSRKATTIARNLPFGSAPGITPKTLPGLAGLLPGPILPFAGLGIAPDGTVYAAADGEGSILALRRR